MPWPRPTLAELINRIQQDFVSQLELSGPILRRSMVFVLSRVLGGASHMQHGNQAWLARQILPDTCEPFFLKRWGAIFGQAPREATFATRVLNVTGTNGTPIPATTELVHASGARFLTDTSTAIAGGIATIPITATDDYPGEIGNVSGQLSFATPILGVTSPANIAAGQGVDGVEAEDIEVFRIRFLAFLASPPSAGNEADYERWAKEVAGVTRAWAYRLEQGAGTIVVRPVRDNDVSIIPDAGEIAQVQAYLDSKRPAEATVIVVPPVANNVTISVSLTPSTAETQAAVVAELKDLFLEQKPGGTLYLSAIRGAISRAAGVVNFTLASPVADVVSTTGYLPVLVLPITFT